MGALHEGHLSLIRKSSHENPVSLVSIFVNPLQFAPHEDLETYPRTLESDLELARRSGASAIFLPRKEDLYPPDFSCVVSENQFSQGLCGAFRPGHFDGVATVVLKLFQLARPHQAYFGLKDAQQFLVLRKMVRDLNIPVEMRGLPTIREEDGLAMSSRNRYLSAEDRARAPILFQVIQTLHRALPCSIPQVHTLLDEGLSSLKSEGFKPQYLEVRSLMDWSKLNEKSSTLPEAVLIAGAAFLGQTRLIDNLIWKSSDAPFSFTDK